MYTLSVSYHKPINTILNINIILTKINKIRLIKSGLQIGGYL